MPSGSYRELTQYLKNLVDSLPPDVIGRYFYLFEPEPHLFLALEVKDSNRIGLIEEKINTIQRPELIESFKLKRDSGDETNGEAVIDLFHAATKYAFYRAGDAFRPGYEHNDPVKVAHCFCNQLFVDPKNEVEFYLACLNHRGCNVEVKPGGARATVRFPGQMGD